MRQIALDRALESLPLFRLSDSTDDSAITYATPDGGRWRVFPAPGDRLPGTFDQDVYLELFHRYHEAGAPADGVISFTLHAFLRSMGRRVDGRTYEQLRSALTRLERTVLESSGAYYSAVPAADGAGTFIDERFTVLTAIAIDRRRIADREQLALFPSFASAEPGDARVTIAPLIRANLAAHHTINLSPVQYFALPSATARRLYRLLEVARAMGPLAPAHGSHAKTDHKNFTWRVALDVLAEQLPLSQRYPSHLQRVLQPAHEMLIQAGLVREANVRQHQRTWVVEYVLSR